MPFPGRGNPCQDGRVHGTERPGNAENSIQQVCRNIFCEWRLKRVAGTRVILALPAQINLDFTANSRKGAGKR